MIIKFVNLNYEIKISQNESTLKFFSAVVLECFYPSGQMLTMLQPMQHGAGTPPLVQPANTPQQPIG